MVSTNDASVARRSLPVFKSWLKARAKEGAGAMKARSAIGSAAFGSREVKIIGEAFEDIWRQI
jgi:hypothetical protein